MNKRYFEPDGLRGQAEELPPLAGRRDIHFSGVEVAERIGGAIVRTRAGIDNTPEAELERLTVMRADFAGLSMDRPRIMGIVNVTPDSFSDGGALGSTQEAVEHGLRLIEDGADLLDIGGESTRPGSDPVPGDEELRRVMPVLESLLSKVNTPISVDTRKTEIMRRAAGAGADIINDVSALSFEPEAMDFIAETKLSVVLAHAQGDPKNMQDAPAYDDVALDIFDYLERRVDACERRGIPSRRIAVDPGIGFGKTVAHNLTLIRRLALFHGLGAPLLVGASRKRFIGTVCGEDEAAARDPGSHAAMLACVARGAQLVRVHDVKGARQALSVWQAIALNEAEPSRATDPRD